MCPLTYTVHSTIVVRVQMYIQGCVLFLYSSENNRNFLMFLLTSMNLDAKFVQTSLSRRIIVLYIITGRPRFIFLPHYGALRRARIL